jgi:hypothetical protein
MQRIKHVHTFHKEQIVRYARRKIVFLNAMEKHVEMIHVVEVVGVVILHKGCFVWREIVWSSLVKGHVGDLHIFSATT